MSDFANEVKAKQKGNEWENDKHSILLSHLSRNKQGIVPGNKMRWIVHKAVELLYCSD